MKKRNRLIKSLIICALACALAAGLAGTSWAGYSADSTQGKWSGTLNMRVVSGGNTVFYTNVAFQLPDIACISLLNGGQGPGGVNPATNIPSLSGVFATQVVVNLSGSVKGQITCDMNGEWSLTPAGSFSSAANMHQYGGLSYFNLPPSPVDLYFLITANGGFISPYRFEANSVCAMTGSYANATLPPTTGYTDFVATRPLAAGGDFDGDGKDDPTMVNVSGNWYVWFSSANYRRMGPFGLAQAEWTPLVGDFDGDGRDDPTMADASGNWYVWFSSADYQRNGPFALGQAGSTPVVGDFDGDRMADPGAVDTNGVWHIWQSGNTYQQLDLALASPGGIPILADFDGDGKADPAVYHNGKWYVYFSTANYAPSGPYSLGAPTGMALARDFDGDGKADPAVVDGFGNWYLWYSSQNYDRVGPFPYKTP